MYFGVLFSFSFYYNSHFIISNYNNYFINLNKNIKLNILNPQKHIDINFNSKKPVIMKYEKFKNYDDVINFLPSFQASIMINNWIRLNENKMESENKIKNNNYINDFDKGIYDMKFFITLNKEQNNTILIAWKPRSSNFNTIAYLIGAKNINNTIYIERLAQNPYYNNLIDVRLFEIKKELAKLINTSSKIKSINYEKLYEYDKRYYLSINYFY